MLVTGEEIFDTYHKMKRNSFTVQKVVTILCGFFSSSNAFCLYVYYREFRKIQIKGKEVENENHLLSTKTEIPTDNNCASSF